MTKALAEKKCVPCRDVRFGSLADIATGPRDFRFYPRKRKSIGRSSMSALCQKRT